ncbi:MAG: cell wall-active antibiotics response protein [Halanaerobiaceae bacterium]|nr:cell wall-active antibiotics response protein [Halanaerobiaceae bacterium]
MKSSYFWGIIIVLLGLALLLNNLGITDIKIGELISTYWPVIFIFFGLDLLIDKRNRKLRSNLLAGTFLIILGLAIIGRNRGLFYFNFALIWNIFWPLVLIFAGLNILKSGSISKDSHLAIMGYIEKKDNWKLDNESYFAFMGAAELDLRGAEIPEGESYLKLSALLGAIELKVPDDVNIICKNTSILGGFEFFNEDNGGIYSNKQFEHKARVETNKKIFIDSFCFMGAIEIDD